MLDPELNPTQPSPKGTLGSTDALLTDAIKRFLFPTLKQHRFSAFGKLTAWRYKADRIEVFHQWIPQSWGNNRIQNLVSTPFQIQLGIYFWAIPQFPRQKFSPEQHPRPFITDCHLRKTLALNPHQLENFELNRWHQNSKKNNLIISMKRSRDLMLSDGFDWFQKYMEPETLLNTLLGVTDHDDDSWGYGDLNSPTRHLYLSYLAKSFGQDDLARSSFEKVLSFNLFRFLHPQIKRDMAQLKSKGV